MQRFLHGKGLRAASFAVLVLLLGTLGQAATHETVWRSGPSEGRYATSDVPLPDRFTITTRFSIGSLDAGGGIWTVGISGTPGGPPTLLAVSFSGTSVSLFGPLAALRLTSDGDMLAAVPGVVAAQGDTPQHYDLIPALLPRDGSYVATLSMDTTNGLTSIRLATAGGEVLVEGHVHLSPLDGPLFAGFGAFGSGGDDESPPAVLEELSVSDGYERFGSPLALSRNVRLRLTESPDGREVLSDSRVVHTDALLEAEIVAPPLQFPGQYRLLAVTPAGEPLELWRGDIPAGQDRMQLRLPHLPAGVYAVVLQYVDGAYEHVLTSGHMTLIAATVEGYIRYDADQKAAEVVLHANRDLSGLALHITATTSEGEATIWTGKVDLRADEPLAMPVDVEPPFEYAVTHDYPEPIRFIQSARKVPLDHPFLLVRVDDYATLRERAEVPPWRQMRAAAQAVVAARPYPVSADIRQKSLALRDIFSAATLMYILDPANRAVYRARLDEAFGRLDDIAASRRRDPSIWDANVPVGNAVLAAILALDVVYYDLTWQQRESVQQAIDDLVHALVADSWTLSSYAVRGTWALFRGDRDTFARYARLYREEIFGVHLSEDGVNCAGPGYALARFAGDDREQKYLFMDILEFTKEASYYEDPRLVAFYEWLFGYSIAPDGRPYTFGDTSPTASMFERSASAGFYRAYRFSDTAGDYAAWWTRSVAPPGSFPAYTLLDRRPTPRRPETGSILADGGAWFGDFDRVTSRWLTGALWNARCITGHSHKDVNAVHLAGYGEHLLVNAGYRGWGNGGLGFAWEYLHDTAVSSNTVLVDGVDHQRKFGAGITSGWIGGPFSFATGDSGDALPNGVHSRTLMALPSSPFGAGYWILLDRVEAQSDGGTVNVALHPNSAAFPVRSSDSTLEWRIGDVQLLVFLATHPNELEIRDGLLAGFGRSSVGKYVYATYGTERGGRRNGIVTVVFPYLEGVQERPHLQRMQGAAYSGARIEQGSSLIDTVLESSGTEPVTIGDVIVQGMTSLFRRVDGRLTFYFVQDGRAFRHHDRGFAAEADVTIVLDGGVGRLEASDHTAITFYEPGIAGVQLDGERLPGVDAGPGWIRVVVPSGTHSLEILSCCEER